MSIVVFNNTQMLQHLMTFLDPVECQQHIPLINKCFNRVCGNALEYLRTLPKFEERESDFYKKRYPDAVIIGRIVLHNALKELCLTYNTPREFSELSNLTKLGIQTNYGPGYYEIDKPRYFKDSQIMELFPKNAHLNELVIDGRQVMTTSSLNTMMPFCSNLLRLDITWVEGASHACDELLQAIGETCQQLRDISLESFACTDQGIQNLAPRFNLLSTVAFKYLHGITDSAVATLLQNCPRITRIVLNLNFQITGQSLVDNENHLPKIREMSLCRERNQVNEKLDQEIRDLFQRHPHIDFKSDL